MQHHRKTPFTSFFTLKLVIILMASLLFIAFLSLLLFFSLSSATHHHQQPSTKPPPKPNSVPPGLEINQACKATRFPDTCESSLVNSNHVPPNPTPTQIIESAMWVSSQNLDTAESMVHIILDSAAGNPNRTTGHRRTTVRGGGYWQQRLRADGSSHRGPFSTTPLLNYTSNNLHDRLHQTRAVLLRHRLSL
ncbi:hypothetical protein TEA_015927 [Camellia sinensis var. sinensis]|uniref:Pectinesterase inhibitor domain-containing protein n=1 Tax=Camellia sinensis var. sinensis TaxID=542762 RepID=A0A4V3WMG7_CAMSN|nr:hypothetical protein TEA_015927 [Camellia sinensis var. sinensis]